MKTPTVISVLAFCADFWICSEHRTVGQKKKKKSKLWRIYSVLWKSAFSVCFPIPLNSPVMVKDGRMLLDCALTGRTQRNRLVKGVVSQLILGWWCDLKQTSTKFPTLPRSWVHKTREQISWCKHCMFYFLSWIIVHDVHMVLEQIQTFACILPSIRHWDGDTYHTGLFSSALENLSLELSQQWSTKQGQRLHLFEDPLSEIFWMGTLGIFLNWEHWKCI